jgi:hypothetical protein
MKESESTHKEKECVDSKNMSSNDEDKGSMTVEEAGRKGGNAPHDVRGLQGSDEQTRERVAHEGGEAPHDERGLQAADQQTRERVAHAGGETVKEAFEAKRRQEGENK